MADKEIHKGSGNMNHAWRVLFGAGAPGWWSLVALGFLFCEFNPVGAIGIAAGLKNVSVSPLGWTLTAMSFLLALTDFIIAERIAYVGRQRRPLEICGIIAIAAGLIPFLVGTAMPPTIMWPISAMFLVTGASGLRACRALPHPAPEANSAAAVPEAPTPSPAPVVDAKAPVAPRPSGSRRRRRRHRSRRPNRDPGGGPTGPR
jgi:hypothetical protein